MREKEKFKLTQLYFNLAGSFITGIQMNLIHENKQKPLHKCWPIDQLINLSCISENKFIKHRLVIYIFMVTQTLLEAIIPMMSLLPVNNSYLASVQVLCRLFSCQFVEYVGRYALGYLLFQIFLTSLLTCLLVTLLRFRNQQFLNYGLNLLTFIYMISALVLFLQTQFILQFTRQENQKQFLLFIEKQVIKGLCIINIILTIGLTVLYNIICHSYSKKLYNHLCKKFCPKACMYDFVFRLLLTLLPYIINLGKNTQNSEFVQVNTVYILLYLTYNLSRLYSQLRYFTYLSSVTITIYHFCLTFQFSVIVVTAICVASQEMLVIRNSVFVIFSIWVFMYKTLFYYIANRDQHYQLLQEDEITNKTQAEMFIWQLNKLFQQEIKNQSLILSNLKRNHENKCLQLNCLCKKLQKSAQTSQTSQQFITKKQIDIKNKQNQIQRQRSNVRLAKKDKKLVDNLQFVLEYEKMLIINIIDRLCDKYQDDMEIIILVAYIKLNVYSIFGDALWRMNILGKNFKNKSMNSLGCNQFYYKILKQKFTIHLNNLINAKNSSLQLAKTERCIQSDQLVAYMLKKYLKIIQLKAQFWTFFSKGIVIHTYFEKKIHQQIQMMKQFQKYSEYIEDNFSKSYLLVSLLVGYERLILFKLKISKKLSQIVKQLKIVHHTQNLFKVQKSKSEKQSVQRWINSSMCCTFETVINFQQMGTVTSVSKNVQTVFGYKNQMILGYNINKLMPTSMQAQHDYLLNSWVRKCSWDNIGKVRNIFCIDRNNVSFSCGIYLKLIQRQSSINIIGSFFKQNSQDYMIIDNKGLIVGAGSRFFNLLGHILVGLPLKIICAEARNIQKWAKQNNKIRHRSIFFSMKQHGQILQRFLENKYSIDGQILSQQIKQILKKNSDSQGHIMQLQVYPYKIGRILFSVIKIQAILSEHLTIKYFNSSLNNSSLLNYQQKLTTASCKQPSSLGANQQQTEQVFLAGNSSVGSSNSCSKYSMENNIDKIEDIFYEKYKLHDQRVFKIIIAIVLFCVLGFIGSSIKISINFSGFKQMQEILFADGACSDNLQLSMFIYNKALTINNRLNNFKATLGDEQYNLLISEVQNQRFDELYLHKLIVEQIYNINKYLTSLSKTVMFKYEKQLVAWTNENGVIIQVSTTRFILNFVYLAHQTAKLSQKIVLQIKNSSITPIQKIDILQKNLDLNLQKMKTNFPQLQKLNTINLQYYKKLFRQTQKIVLTTSYVKVVITIFIVVIILGILERHYCYRQRQVQDIYLEYRQLPIGSVISLITYFMDFKYLLKDSNRRHGDYGDLTNAISSNLTHSVAENSCSNLMNGQNQKSIKNFSSHQFTSKSLKQEKKPLQAAIKQPEQNPRLAIEQKLIKINTLNQVCTTELLTKSPMANKKAALLIKEKSTSFFYLFCAIIIALISSINCIMLVREKAILETALQIVTNINGLMNSENIVISTYFYIKGQYNLGQQSSQPLIDQNFINKLLQKINKTKTEVVFTKIAADSLYLFNQYDPNYSGKMIKILTSNICNMIQNQLPIEYYNKCIKDEEIKMLKYGIMNSMNFFTRRITAILYEIIEKKHKQLTKKDLSSMATISSVDKTLIHMLKMYQQTQAHITQSFIVAIDNLIFYNLLLVSVEYVLFFSFIMFMVVFYQKQKRRVIKKIGRILIIPIKILQTNRQIMRNFQKIIDYDNIK